MVNSSTNINKRTMISFTHWGPSCS